MNIFIYLITIKEKISLVGSENQTLVSSGAAGAEVKLCQEGWVAAKSLEGSAELPWCCSHAQEPGIHNLGSAVPGTDPCLGACQHKGKQTAGRIMSLGEQ